MLKEEVIKISVERIYHPVCYGLESPGLPGLVHVHTCCLVYFLEV